MQEKKRIVRRRYANIGISSLCMCLVYFIGCQPSIKSIGEKECSLLLCCCFLSSCFWGLIGESISLPPPNRVYHILWNVCLVMFGGQKFRQRQVGKVEDGRKHYHIHPAAASTTVQ